MNGSREAGMSEDRPTHLPPEVLRDWLQEVVSLLGVNQQIDPDTDIGAILDLTRHVSHSVVRPAGPLTMLAVGLQLGERLGAGDPIGPALAEVAPTIRDLATNEGNALIERWRDQ